MTIGRPLIIRRQAPRTIRLNQVNALSRGPAGGGFDLAGLLALLEAGANITIDEHSGKARIAAGGAMSNVGCAAFIFNSSGAQTGSRYNNWPDLADALAATEAVHYVAFEQSERTPDGFELDMRGGQLVGNRFGAPWTAEPVLTFGEGSTLVNPAMLMARDGIRLHNASSTPVRVITTPSTPIVVENDVVITANFAPFIRFDIDGDEGDLHFALIALRFGSTLSLPSQFGEDEGDYEPIEWTGTTPYSFVVHSAGETYVNENTLRSTSVTVLVVMHSIDIQENFVGDTVQTNAAGTAFRVLRGRATLVGVDNPTGIGLSPGSTNVRLALAELVTMVAAASSTDAVWHGIRHATINGQTFTPDVASTWEMASGGGTTPMPSTLDTGRGWLFIAPLDGDYILDGTDAGALIRALDGTTALTYTIPAGTNVFIEASQNTEDDPATEYSVRWTSEPGGGGVVLSDDDPAALGTAAPGTSDEASRADHVHELPTRTELGLGTAADADVADFDAAGTGDTAANDVIVAHLADTDPHGDRTYAASLFAANDALVFKGVIDCSGSPAYPAANAGETYKVSVAGKIGGLSGPKVEVGDLLLCTVDSSAGGNHATVGANWTIGQVNIDGAVTGPSTATDGHVVLMDGTSGRLIKDSGITLGDAAAKNTGTTAGTVMAGNDARWQPTGAELTALAALSGTAFGRGFITLADHAALITKLALVAADIPAIAESGVTGLVADLAAKVPTTRTLAGLDLSADRTASAIKTALSLVKGDVGLGSVDNTADASKTFTESQITGLVTDLAAKLALSTFTTKGDLAVASGSGAAARLGVGTDGYGVVADSTASNGLKYGPTSPPLVPSTVSGGSANYGLPGSSISGVTTAVLGANVTHYTVFPVRFPITVNLLIWDVFANLAASNVHVCLSAFSATGQPTGAPLLDSGSKSSAATGVNSFSGSVNLLPGIYGTVLECDSGTVALRAGVVTNDASEVSAAVFGGTNNIMVSNRRASRTYSSSFPTPCPAYTTVSQNSGAAAEPLVLLRWVAL